MSDDINPAVDKSCFSAQQAGQIRVTAEQQGLLKAQFVAKQSVQALLLILLVGILSSILGFATYSILLWREEQAMQDAKIRAAQMHGQGLRIAGSDEAQQSSRHTPSESAVVEYEDGVTLTADDTTSVPNPHPVTSSAIACAPTKMAASDNCSQRSAQPIGIPSLQTNGVSQHLRPLQIPEPFGELASKAEERGPLTAEVTDGNNNYVWDDNSEYFGEWENGKAHGRGVFSWPNADRYEGEWRNGLENGVGTFIAANGSTFYGPWSNGKMHGQGMYQPVMAGTQNGDTVYTREYKRGALIKETKLRDKEVDYLRKELKRDQRARRSEKRQAAKEMNAPPRPGETIYKGHRSYNLMRSLQQGISFSVASVDKQVTNREAGVKPSDFKKEIVQHMPSSGEFPPFKWKDYSPHVFHCLREAFGIDSRDYLISITNRNTLRELPSPGKSGSVFFISDDERFMIKTVRKEEMHLLIDLIPKYYNHCVDNPDTLLTRFYGVHRIKPISGPQVRFVIMGNVFPTETKMDRRFDLKGSSHGRTAGSKKDLPDAVLKDLDVDFRLQLKDELYKKLMRQIKADAALLERMRVMDYSLLLGIHYTEEPNATEHSKLDQRDSLAMEEGESPTRCDQPNVPWSREFEAAEVDASRFGPQEPIFTAWRSQRHLEVDEPSPPRFPSDMSSSRGDGTFGGFTTNSLRSPNEDPPMSEVSSLTSASLCSTWEAQHLQNGVTDTAVMGAPRESLKSSFSSPRRPSRFALESQGDIITSRGAPMSTARCSNLENGHGAGTKLDQQKGWETDVHSRESMASSVPRLLQMLNRFSTRDDSKPTMASLERTRSGWVKAQAEGTSLRNLHIPTTPHMGLSIPAVAYPLREDGTADTDIKPQPVTLFFGIIDFLQLYNLRKWSEHQLKSIVHDGTKISVVSPKTYAKRFTKHMQTLFIPIPSQ